MVRKQQKPVQSQYGMLEVFMIFCYLNQCLLTEFAENLLTRKKIQIKAWYNILGREILSCEEFHYANLRGKQIIPSKMKIVLLTA